MFPTNASFQRRNTVSNFRSPRIRGILKKTLTFPARSKSLNISDDDEEENFSLKGNRVDGSFDDGGIFVDGNAECGESSHREGEMSRAPISSSKHVMFSDDNKCHEFEEASGENSAEDSSEVSELWSKCELFQQVQGSEDRKSRDGSLSKEGFEREPELVLCFTDPCSEMNFANDLKEKKVKLERCKVRDRHILGIVLLQCKESTEHPVVVRYSTNKWDTCTDVTVKCTDEGANHLTFDLEFPQGVVELEFVVLCQHSSGKYVDDNFGEKYKVQDIRRIMALEEGDDDD